MLRGDKAFTRLRKAIESRGIDLTRCLLGGYVEDEEGAEYGLVVNADKAVSFERNTNNDKIKSGMKRHMVGNSQIVVVDCWFIDIWLSGYYT